MSKLVEIGGCIEVPIDVDTDFVIDRLIEFIEDNGWSFGGGYRTIIDDWYVDNKGKKVERVDAE